MTVEALIKQIQISIKADLSMAEGKKKLRSQVQQLKTEKLSGADRTALLNVLCEEFEIKYADHTTKIVSGLRRLMALVPDVLPTLLGIVKDLSDAPTRLMTTINNISFIDIQEPKKETGWQLLYRKNLPAFIQLLDIVLKNKDQEVKIVKNALAIDKTILQNENIRTKIWLPMGHYYYQEVKDFTHTPSFVASAIVDYILSLPLAKKRDAFVEIYKAKSEVGVFLGKFPTEKRRIGDQYKKILQESKELAAKNNGNADRYVNSSNLFASVVEIVSSQTNKDKETEIELKNVVSPNR